MQLSKGQRLDHFIRSLKMNHTSFGESIGSTKSTVGNWVNKSKSPHGDQLYQIMKVYPQLNIRWWFEGKGDMLTSGATAARAISSNEFVMALGEKEVEIIKLKKLNRELLEGFAEMLEGRYTPEQLEEIRKQFEKREEI